MNPDRAESPLANVDRLNENHRRHLRIMFQLVDEDLTEIVRLLDSTQAQSPFSEFIADATPVQHRVIADYAARTRSRMRTLLEQHGVSLPQPHISSIWAARARLLAAGITVEELRPDHMRGYGELSETARKDLSALVAELMDINAKMEAYLAQVAGRDLQDRLSRLPAENNTVQVLRELERIITSRGLVAFRSVLALLLERLESNQYEVAVFGRVSSGKSSLLNYVLQTPVLPVGVTPVTAVPIRILHGPAARAIISFAQAERQVINLARVPEFVTEQQNPSNARHVTRVAIEIPSPRLEEGIVFVDTPGLGALAHGGAAESLAYLPRCDLGIVMVDASSTLTEEDLAVVDALHHAGADAIVLLSKADLLSPDDRRRMLEYATAQLQSNIGTKVDVHLVSVSDHEAHLTDEWFEGALLPKLHAASSLAEISLARKAKALRDNVLAVLKGPAIQGSAPLTATRELSSENGDGSFPPLLAQLDAERNQTVAAYDRPSELTNKMVDQLVREISAAWKEHPDSADDTHKIAAESLERFFASTAEEVAGNLLRLRSSLISALKQPNTRGTGTDEILNDLPLPTGLPMVDTSAIVARLQVHPPTLGFLAPRVRSHGIRKQVEASIAGEAAKAIHRYGKQLDDWRLRYLQELRSAFTVAMDLYQANHVHVPRDESPQSATNLQQDIDRLEALDRKR